MIIIHHNDADGRCAAAITASVQTEPVTFWEVDYKTEIDVAAIPAASRVAVVDFSLKPEVMAAVRARASEVVWIDHHKTAAAYPYQDLPGRRDFAKSGLAGCELAWSYYRHGEPLPRAVLLLGDYDAWRLYHVPETFEFYEGLKLHPHRPMDAIWAILFHEIEGKTAVACVCEQGQIAIQYRDTYCAEMRAAFGYETRIGGHRAYACNIYRFGSKGFGDLMDRFTLCIAYAHDGLRFTVSLYSTQVDVGEIARQFGGGGHAGAAGFQCDMLPFQPHMDVEA